MKSRSELGLLRNLARNLNWTDRARISPTRIGAFGDYNLGMGDTAPFLNRLSDERADTSAALAMAGLGKLGHRSAIRQMSRNFGETLALVTETAKDLGVPVGDRVKAMLDAHSVSFSGEQFFYMTKLVCLCGTSGLAPRGSSLRASNGKLPSSLPSYSWMNWSTASNRIGLSVF